MPKRKIYGEDKSQLSGRRDPPTWSFAYHESFVRNYALMHRRKSNQEKQLSKDNIEMNEMMLESSHLGLLVDPKSDPSVSQVSQYSTYVGVPFYHGGQTFQSHIKETVPKIHEERTTYWKWSLGYKDWQIFIWTLVRRKELKTTHKSFFLGW